MSDTKNNTDILNNNTKELKGKEFVITNYKKANQSSKSIKILAAAVAVSIALGTTSLIATLNKDGKLFDFLKPKNKVEDENRNQNKLPGQNQQSNQTNYPYVMSAKNEQTIEQFIKNIAPLFMNLTEDEVKKAVYLANYGSMFTTDVFYSKQDILNAMMDLGTIANTYGYDKLVDRKYINGYFIEENLFNYMIQNVCRNNITINDFANAKNKNNGYDIYKVLDIVIAGLNTDRNVDFARLMNEIVTDATNNFTILESAPNETIYAVLAAYNANRDKIVKLTHGHNWGPIYGFGVDQNNQVVIDGTYGNICGEEIDKFVRCTEKNDNYKATDNNLFYNENEAVIKSMLSGYTR